MERFHVVLILDGRTGALLYQDPAFSAENLAGDEAPERSTQWLYTTPWTVEGDG